ncbi:hypothetical protein LCUFL03_330037 [Latilactobacillus curvatus]|nr:hypothetical protein LCUFL03_330037 [Latilactobacillus curvatus]
MNEKTTLINNRVVLFNIDGPDQIRTGDLLHAKQALSQLSYGPKRLQKYFSTFS